MEQGEHHRDPEKDQDEDGELTEKDGLRRF